MRVFPVGKLPADVLQRLLLRFPVRDPRVVSGPAIGEDATAIDFGDRYLIAKTDPITFAADEIGSYAVRVNANDVACRGATPKWFLWTLLLPEAEASEEMAERIFEQTRLACEALQVEIVGGHTEITYGLDRPIVVGQMLGEVDKDRLVTTSGARINDVILMTKGAPIEGVAILARERESQLLSKGVQQEVLSRAKYFLHDPGISVVREAMAACEAARVHAMHDPTEGGLATGLREIAIAANVGMRIDEDEILILPVAKQFAQAMPFDPMGMIASGTLLIVVAPEDVGPVCNAVREQAIACRAIGELLPPEQGIQLINKNGEARELPTFERDEIARFF